MVAAHTISYSILLPSPSFWNILWGTMSLAEGQNQVTVVTLEARSLFWMSFSFSFLSKESMQEFQEWFSGVKAAAKESSDRTGDSKVLEAKICDLQVRKLGLLFRLQTPLPDRVKLSLLPNLILFKLFCSHHDMGSTKKYITAAEEFPDPFLLPFSLVSILRNSLKTKN